MAKFRSPAVIFAYLIAVWHGYVLLALPLAFHNFPMPFRHAIDQYSQALLVDQPWSYFYKPPVTNSELYYSINGSPHTQKFFGSSHGYLQRSRFYRCGSCARATYKMQENIKMPDGRWLIGHYLCAFHTATDRLKVEVKSAPYNSSDFQTVNSQDILCSSYQ